MYRNSNMEQKKHKLLIVLPDGKIHKLKLWGFQRSFREAPVTATFLAGLVPDELGFDLSIVDESVSKIDFDRTQDLVAISLLTGTSERAYEIAQKFKKLHGSTIIMGGVHVQLLPDEVVQFADTIVIGYAEEAWPQLLRDFANGQLQKVYNTRGKGPEILDNLPIPRRDLQKKLRYNIPGSTFATRGCLYNCDFCTTAALETQLQFRPVHEVIDDIRSIPNKYIAFNDVNIINDRDYALELFEALTPLKKIWGALATVHVAKDPEMLEAMTKSGCRYLLVGLESVNRSSLKDIHKGFNAIDKYKQTVQTLHDHKISIQGCFIFGMDSDEIGIFDDTVELVNELKIDIPRYAIFTPYPGTPAFDQMKSEGRLLHTRWKYYDTQHVVFQPKLMSVRDLEEGFKKAYKDTFTLASNFRRSIKNKRFSIINFAGNAAYFLFIRKLYGDMDRFPSSLEEMDRPPFRESLAKMKNLAL